MKEIKELLVRKDVSIKEAWKQLNNTGFRTVLVIDNEKLIGSVTDGDIRRWILADRSILEPVERIMCKKPIIAHEKEGKENIKKKLISYRIDCLPVVDGYGHVTEVVSWDEFIENGEASVVADKINLPVVIMAGGRGERLDPFTKILPKPLIPINDKPVIEIIMEEFCRYGVSDFFLSVNYKSTMIKAYFQDIDHSYNISYIEEDKPCGTAGSLSLLREKISTTFIVSNADILVEANYPELMRFHTENKNLITLVCSMKHFPIPYGVVEIENGGTLKGIHEKPEFDRLVLTGLYVIEPDVIKMIPPNREFNMTDLIGKIKCEGGKIGVYPVADRAWMDIGEFEEYKKTLKRFE